MSGLDDLKAMLDRATPVESEQSECDHGVTFNEVAAKGLDARTIRRQWPRLHGACPKGCGFVGIGYASYAHYLYGDW